MNAVPDILPAAVLPQSSTCPVCQEVHVSDPVDAGWVRCPLAEGAPTCLSCCLMLQSLTRVERMPPHHPATLGFEGLATRTGRPRAELRLRCVQHQLDVLADEAAGETDMGVREEKARIIDRLARILRNASAGEPG